MLIRVFTVFFVLLSLLVHGQSQSSTLSAESWLATITKEKNSKRGSDGSGFALYFAPSGNIRQPYLVYVPVSYTPAKPMPVIIFLHGAILARDSFQYKDPAIANEPIFSIAESLKTIVVFPFARADFKWAGQSPAYENIISIIKQVERDYDVDKNKVYIGGISMGGIATFWFVNNHPEIFAGFYTFSAAPHSPDGEIKYSNITKSKPLFSLNAKDDPVFSYSDMEAAYNKHKGDAPGWHHATVDAGGHRFIYGKGGEAQVKSLLSNLLGDQQ